MALLLVVARLACLRTLPHWGSIRGAAETDIGCGFSVVSGDGLVAEPVDGQF